MLDAEALQPGTRLSDLLREFCIFYSAYFKHGDVENPETYETRIPLADPPPTWRTFTPEEIDVVYEPVPGDARGGIDGTLMGAGITVGAFGVVREAALHLAKGSGVGSGDSEAGSWDGVKVRHVWGDHSVAAMVYAMHALRAELDTQEKAGTRLRDVTFARIEGGNHIVSVLGECGFGSF